LNVHRILFECRWGAAAALLFSGAPAAAQHPSGHSSSILVSATVVSDRLSVAVLRPVEFTVRCHGGPTTVQPTESAAGEWRLIGTSNAMIRMNLALPTALVNSRDTTATPLTIGYATTAGRWRADVEDAAQATVFDPRQGASGQFGRGPDPALYVWLGGSVQAAPDTATGTYQGAATLTLFYY
jgi:hypothetical protein